MKRAVFLWRMFLAYPRILRLGYRVWVWNTDGRGTIDERLRRTPGAMEEFNEIAKYVCAGLAWKVDEED